MILDHLPALERALKAKGFPAMSPWWRATFESFYRSGRRQAVLRCGRRAGKSSSLCRIGVLEALYGEHQIPPGDVGIVGIVSVSRDEAAQRLRTVKAILDAIGVKYRPIDGGIELVDRPIVFKVFTASIAGVVGGTWICIICDEVARWRDADTGSNPATQVLASLRPTMATQPRARLFLSSSPLGRLDAHAVAFDAGDSDFQQTAHAPTWVANPTLTEDDCRALEPDADTFAREYGAIPFDGTASSLFSESALLAVTRQGPAILRPEPGVSYVAAQDPASRSNAWSLAIAALREVDENTSICTVVLAREWRAPRGGVLDSDATLCEISHVLGEYGIEELWTDQWSFDTLASIASRHGVTLRLEAATQTSKVQLFEALRRRVADRTIELPDDPAVRADLLGVRKWVGKGGGFTIELERAGGRHSDFSPAIALVADKAISTAGANWASAYSAWAKRDFSMDGNAKSKPPITVRTYFGNGMVEATGNEPKFTARMRALWHPHGAREPQYTAECSAEFKAALREYRNTHCI